MRLLDEDFRHSDHSIHHDASLGLFLTHHEIYKNVARNYAANTENPKAGWMLQEDIPGSAKVSERDGKAHYSDVKAYVEDDCSNNRVGNKGKGEPGILCDLGGMWAISLPHPKAKPPAKTDNPPNAEA